MRIFEYARAAGADPLVVQLIVTEHLTHAVDRAGARPPWQRIHPSRMVGGDDAVYRRHGRWMSVAEQLDDELLPALDRLLADPAITGPLVERVARERERSAKLIEMDDHGVLCRVPEAAAATEVDERKIRVWMNRGRLPFYELSDGKKYVFTNDVWHLHVTGAVPERVDTLPEPSS
jgi:hypothetical protein